MPRGGARPGAGRPKKIPEVVAGTATAPLPVPSAGEPGNFAPVIPITSATPRPDAFASLTAALSAPSAPIASNDNAPPPSLPPEPGRGKRLIEVIVKKSAPAIVMGLEALIEKQGYTPRDADDDDIDDLKGALEDFSRETFPDLAIPSWIQVLILVGFLYLSMRVGAKKLPPSEPVNPPGEIPPSLQRRAEPAKPTTTEVTPATPRFGSSLPPIKASQ